MMQPQEFMHLYRAAFGERAELPILFSYTAQPLAEEQPVAGCLFRCLDRVRRGEIVSFSASTVGCGGGRFYTGFAPMPDRVPDFVSLNERYKRDPESVRAYLEQLQVPSAPAPYLNLLRLDLAERFDGAEGLLFLASPDMLAGLTAWANYDNGQADAVAAPFGSGCSSIFTQAVIENRRGGRRTFLGLFDPSARPYIEKDLLSFTIPARRLEEMLVTLPECCLGGTHDWLRVRKRLTGEEQ